MAIGLSMASPSASINQEMYYVPEVRSVQIDKKVYPRSTVGKESQSYCSCVQFSKEKTGYQGSVGFAKNWKRNSETPQVGGVVITSESSAGGVYTGHVAVISAVNYDTNTITIDEANYIRCKRSTRTLAMGDHRIIGYWIPTN